VKKRWTKPSPPMVVAAIALFVALAGSGVAAVTSIPNNSVGTAQLKPNSIVSSKVANHSLLAADFKDGQLPRGATGPAGPGGGGGVSRSGGVGKV
jgi:hypothetical protein